MKQRIMALLTFTAVMLLACAPIALADGEGGSESNDLATFLAIVVVAVSMGAMVLSNRYFNKKRRENERKNRQRAKKKKR